jgi:hypothetical protein
MATTDTAFEPLPARAEAHSVQARLEEPAVEAAVVAEPAPPEAAVVAEPAPPEAVPEPDGAEAYAMPPAASATTAKPLLTATNLPFKKRRIFMSCSLPGGSRARTS